jgi:antirestriction protein ArdC
MQKKTDVHQLVTDRIIAMLEAGAGDFRMPWHKSSSPLHIPINALTGKRYRGINVVSLWCTAEERGYTSNEWGTYKQWQEKKAQVRGGEKAALVMFFKEYHVEPSGETSDDDGRRVVAKASWAFNAAQVEGYEAPKLPEQTRGPIERIAAADAFARGTGAIVRHGGDRAFYSPGQDFVQMPDERLFLGDEGNRKEAYYSTLLHELTHWSGAEKRLAREFGKRFGDKSYSFEELVAELGAAFLCASLGITNEPRRDHAQYLAHWLAILKEDKKAITHAAAKASAAADYLESLADTPAEKLAA